MKKLTLFVAVVAVSASLASCKKDYKCECTSGGVVVGTINYKDTKKKATDACKSANSTYAAYGADVSCSIK